MNDLVVETRVSLSKKFPPGVSELKFGRYILRAIPSGVVDGCEAVLRFSSDYHSPEGGGSHPDEEAANICRLISLVLNVTCQRTGLRLNDLDIPSRNQHKTYTQFSGELDGADLIVCLKRLLSLGDDLARQFLRAAHAYSFALNFIPSDITFAFFLLTVSVECLSSQDEVIPYTELDPERKKAERFVAFVRKYLRDEDRGVDEQNVSLFKELLKTIYYSHRSGFVHGGKEVSHAAMMADNANSSYFKHELDGKEVKTPGIGWFAGVARSALVGFLRSSNYKQQTEDQSLIARLSHEKAGLRLKAKRSITQHTIVTLDDIEYR